jgi:hypothetical protein
MTLQDYILLSLDIDFLIYSLEKSSDPISTIKLNFAKQHGYHVRDKIQKIEKQVNHLNACYKLSTIKGENSV